jgi:hypothetical protein
MPESCHSCGTALLERGVFCSVCGTPAEPGVGPTKGDNYSAAGPGTLEADGRIVFRLGLAAATFGMLLIGIVVMLADRSSPPDGRPAVISPISKNGAKPSPAPPADFTSEEHEPSWSTATPATHAFVESSPPPKRNNAASQASAVPARPSGEANKTGGRMDRSRSPSSAGVTTRSTNRLSQLQFETGDRLWIRVTFINRYPNGSFTFRGTLLEPFVLAGVGSLDQSTGLAGAGTVGGGHTRVLVTGFTLRGGNYGLRTVSRASRRPGSGPAVELNAGKTFEMWFASASVYKKSS